MLATLPQPLALLEVGASAGLCLYPDRYSYRYGDHVVGSGEPVLECAATGLAPPGGVPDVVWSQATSAGSPGVLSYDALPKPPGKALHNVLALDGTPLAWTRAHGQAIIWFA